MSRGLFGAACAMALASPVAAQNVLTPTIIGGGSSLVLPGEVVEVGFDLTGPTAAHNSAIFRVIWSESVVELLSVAWQPPYATGGVFDDSVPSATALPMVVTPGLLTGFGYPANVADIELSNVVPPGPGGGEAGAGRLVTLRFRVLADVTVDRFLLSAVPDTFARGATAVAVEPGPSTLFIVVPGPGAGVGVFMVMGAMVARRRRA